MLWTEKYRPKDISELEAPEYIKNLVNSTSNAHLLLYGPPGTGKTTFAHLISKNTKKLELNASDDRGIATIRSKIKTFANSLVKKTIILDESENLTKDAQQCLRRIIEDYSENTRFIFTTNYASKIISPLKSRLFAIKFENTDNRFVYLKNIGTAENLNLSDEFYRNLFSECGGDLRRSLNVLQGVAPFVDQIRDISEYTGQVPHNFIERFASLKTRDVQVFVEDFLKGSFSFLQFLLQLNSCFCELNLDVRLLNDMSLSEYRSVHGCQTEILLTYLCYKQTSYNHIK